MPLLSFLHMIEGLEHEQEIFKFFKFWDENKSLFLQALNTI